MEEGLHEDLSQWYNLSIMYRDHKKFQQNANNIVDLIWAYKSKLVLTLVDKGPGRN